MGDLQGLKQRWEEFRPSKTATFWSCVACIGLTMLVGFTWGGWVTGGTSEEMAQEAASDARAQLAATVCVDRFLEAPDATMKLASLKKADSWNRGDLIEDAGWVTLSGMKEPVPQAADLCVTRLMTAEATPAKDAAAAAGATVKN
jgi:hypothetical protein